MQNKATKYTYKKRRSVSVTAKFPYFKITLIHDITGVTNRSKQLTDTAVGRKILNRASKSVTDSPETKWCDSFSQSKGGKLYLAH